jgi:hypothetical protein
MNSKNPNHIFLFILDAVRKDHLSLYGYRRKTSPNIDKLAKQSEIYNWAISPSSYTHAAIPSILTGKYPFELSNPFYSWQFTKKEEQLLKKIKKQGYKIYLFTAHIASSSKNSNIYKLFDYVYEDLSQSETNRKEMLVGESKNIINQLISHFKKNKKNKTFYLIHLMEAHGPYKKNYESIFINDILFKQEKRRVERVVFDNLKQVDENVLKSKVIPRYQLYQPIIDENGNIEDFNPEIKYYVSHYDMGIYIQDKYLGLFFNFLKKINVFNQSLITITSDHGELIGEDNLFFSHGIYTHPSLINVPLIIKWPNQKKQIVNNNNFSNQYLIPKLFPNIDFSQIISSYLSKDCYLSFNANSFSILKDEYLLMLHNGRFHFNGQKYDLFFPTWELNENEIIENYLKFNIKPHFKIFKKSKYFFKETNRIESQEIKKFFEIFLNINKKIYQTIIEKNNTQINDLKTKQIQLEETINQKENQINQLKATLNKIYTSKTWRLLYLYKKLTGFLKKN